MIVGTGFVTDLRLRPELARVEPHIARWADRYTPPAGERTKTCSRHPYLGPNFEFTERTPGSAPYLALPLQLHLRRPAQPGLRRRQHLGHEVLDPAAGRPASRARSSSRIASAYFQSLCDFAEKEF